MYELERSLKEHSFLGLLGVILFLAIGLLFAGVAGLALILGHLAVAGIAVFAVKYRWSSCPHNLLGPRYQIAYLVMMDTNATGIKEPDIERATRFLTAEAAHPMSLGAAGFLGVRDISPTEEFVYLWPRDTSTIEKNLRALIAYISNYPNESRSFISDANQLLHILRRHYGGQTLRLEKRWAIYRTTIERLGNESVQITYPSTCSDECNAESEHQPQTEPYGSYEEELNTADSDRISREEDQRSEDQRREWNAQNQANYDDWLKRHEESRGPSKAESGQAP